MVQVFMLPSDTVLDEPALRRILSSGHSRVPVHAPGNKYASHSTLEDSPTSSYEIIPSSLQAWCHS